MDVTPLFQPLSVRGKLLPNRIVMAPTTTRRPLGSPQSISWYAEHARGEAGLVIVESSPAHILADQQSLAALRPLVEAIHGGGALAAIQMVASAETSDEQAAPADLDASQLDALVAEHRKAVEICVQAGFDGVSSQAGHGGLLGQFLSPVTNERDDEYGGTFENRARLTLRILEAMREAAGDALLILRLTPAGPGYEIEESIALARAAVRAGVDILDISPCPFDANSLPATPPVEPLEPGALAAPFMGLGAVVMAGGGLDLVGRALAVLKRGRADLVAISRGLIADPEWPRKVREGRPSDLTMCVKCNKLCYGNMGRGLPIACTQWRPDR